MPLPTIGKAKKKKGASPKTEQSQEEIQLSLAKEAVAAYQTERNTLNEMREQFESDYPDAHQFLQDIKRQEDLVVDAIESAKSLVSSSKQTVGDFIAKRKYSTPKYDDAAFTQLVGQAGDGETLISLIQQGHVKKVVLDKGAVAWFVQHPNLAEEYNDAFRPKAEMTTAVTTPKLS